MIAEAMMRALELARQAAARDEVPVGAVVLGAESDGGRQQIIGEGSNDREARQSPVSHAELHALDAASKALGSWRLEGCTLVVTLEPCPMCLGAIQQARIARVVYGAADPKGGAISLGYRLNEDGRTNHRFAVDHLPTPEAGSVLSDFFARKRNPAR